MMTGVLPLVGRRLVASVFILLIVSFLLFVVLHVLPVDPAAMSVPPNATLAEIEAKRVEMGTASSPQAVSSAAGARPLAQMAWKFAQQAG